MGPIAAQSGGWGLNNEDVLMQTKKRKETKCNDRDS